MNKTILKKAAIEAQLKELSTIPNGEYLSEFYCFSEAFEKKMNDLIYRVNQQYITLIGFSLRKTMVAMIVAMVFLTGCISVKSIREPVMQFFVEIYETFSRISFSQSENTRLDDDFVCFLPNTPDGYYLASVAELDKMYEAEFTHKDGSIILYSQIDPDGVNLTIDTEGVEMIPIYINDYLGFKFSNKGMQNIIWTDDRYSYSLIGTCDFSILEEMVKTIK